MWDSRMFDVIVVGSGPGGSVAAKRCAERGLDTLLIEKKSLPRDKVCTGMVMGDWAGIVIRREFGDIPRTVLVDPPHLTGHRIHVAGAEPLTLEWDTPLAWRKDLDFWMVQEAKAAGVTLLERAKVVRVASDGDASSVTIVRDGITEKLRARFVIGADGATSPVRRSLFPELKVRYAAAARRHYRGGLNLERDLIHWFFPRGLPTPRFNLNHKDDVFLMEGRALRVLRHEINETLGPYGFQRDSEPVIRDSCAIALLGEQLLTGAFSPAHGNTLLVGDAAGFILPITFEGIGSALKSGINAAESIAKAAETGRQAAAYYIDTLNPILETLRRLRAVQADLEKDSREGPDVCARSLVAAYKATMTFQRQ